MLQHGAAWDPWRAKREEKPDLSRAGLRGLDLSGFDLSGADLRGADLRGTNSSETNLSGGDLEGANLFKAVLDGADLTGAFLYGVRFLNCAQLVVAQNWQSTFRDEAIACGEAIRPKVVLIGICAGAMPCRSSVSGRQNGQDLPWQATSRKSH